MNCECKCCSCAGNKKHCKWPRARWSPREGKEGEGDSSNGIILSSVTESSVSFSQEAKKLFFGVQGEVFSCRGVSSEGTCIVTQAQFLLRDLVVTSLKKTNKNLLSRAYCQRDSISLLSTGNQIKKKIKARIYYNCTFHL